MIRIASAVAIVIVFVGCHSSSRVTEKLELELADTRDKLKTVETELNALKEQSENRNSERGIGVPRARVIQTLSNQFKVEFEDLSKFSVGLEQFKATIGGVHVHLWGPADNLDAITVIGSFEGDYGSNTGLVLTEVLNLTTPEWPVKERADWFGKAAARSDNDVTVSTLRSDIVVTVVSAEIDQHNIRTISLKRYQK